MNQQQHQMQTKSTKLIGGGPDFARGIRSDLSVSIEPNDDYARGSRTLAKDRTIRPDYARGARQLSQDITIHPDYARGLRAEK
ncbi:MAG TPA: hypothetical protein VFK30_06985 [Anaerolineae bacterium]|nr:hypothetical protein [Anaerolineae bacterium]